MKRIDSYTGIRFYWALTIIFCHLYWIYEGIFYHGKYHFLKHGGFAVTGFFIVSGFLVCMHYGEKFVHMSWKDGISFLCRHAKKWYLLYLVSMIPAVFDTLFQCRGITEILKFCGKLGMNLLLVQAWIPFHEYSINRVSWFLSCICAIYLVTPLLLYLNNRIKNSRKICTIIALVCIGVIYIMADQNGIYIIIRFFVFFNIVWELSFIIWSKEYKKNYLLCGDM